MKKARNFWRDLPQGGSRYGSVLTRLFLLLCLLATTQAGWATNESITMTASGVGLSGTSSNSSNAKNQSHTYTSGLKIDINCPNGYNYANSKILFKNNATLTLTAPTGNNLKSITITHNNNKWNTPTITGGGSITSGEGNTKIWTGDNNSVTFTFGTGDTELTKLDITYESTGSSTPANLTDSQFAWSAASYTATIGGSNTFPTLTNTVPVDVTYSATTTEGGSTASDVASIDNSGYITLNKAGTAYIKAAFAGNSSYNAKTVTYTLTVNAASATVDAPTFNPASGTIAASTNNVTVTYPSGATLYTRWSGNSGAYSATDMIAEDFKNTTGATGSQTEGTRYLYAIAVKDGVNSAIKEQEYTVTCKPTLALSSTSMSLNTSDNTSATSTITATNFKSESISHSKLTYTVSSNDENVATATVNQSTGVVTVTAVGAGTATITVGNTAGGVYLAADAVTISVTVAAAANVAPSITAQPTGATYTQNATATPLSVTATGTPTPTYQWYSNSTSSTTGASTISGATSPTYTPLTTTVGTTYYYCVATNSEGTATSNIVAVTVNSPSAGSSATFDFINTDWDNRGGSDGQKTETQNGITFEITGSGQIRTTVKTSTKFSTSSTFTISAEEGKQITSVVISQKDNNQRIKPSGTSGTDWTFSSTGSAAPYTHTYTFTSPSNSINFSTSGAAEDVYSITVNYKTESGPSPTPSIAFNSPTTTVAVGATVTTNKATLSNASGTEITYSSSDATIASVDSSTGEVTGEAAGKATITATYTESGTDYTASYEITVTAAPTPSAGKTWDFTTTWNKTESEIKASSEWNTSMRNENALDNAELTVGGTKIDVTEGLKFTSDAKNVELHPDKYIVLRSNATTFTVPNVAAGSTITISTCGDSGNSGVKATTTNVTKTSGSNSSSPSDFVFSVTTTGDCSFARAQGSNTRIYKITVTSAVTVADPTVTPVTDANFSASPKSVTFTTNETGGETYYVVGATRETNAATIANGTRADEGANDVNVSTFVTNESNAVISAVTKKGDDYSSIVYVDLTYNGTITAKIGNNENVQIQQGNYATITPTITDAAGKPLKFDQDEDATVDYSQYYDFTYAVKTGTTPSQYCSLDATTGKVNTRDASNNKAAVGATITVTVTATPKASPAVTLNYVKNEELTKDITFTVVKEDETVLTQWVDFYWDEACTRPISENDGDVMGQEKSQKMIFTNFPNGKVIYAKVNKEYADMICFYYNNKDTSEPTAEVSKVSGKTDITNNNGKKYRYRQCLPIYKDADGAGTDGDKVWVTLGGYKENADATVGKFINMQFTLKANSSRPAAPTYTPGTATSDSGTKTKMTTAKASTANGDPNGTVMAKYSTNNSYTIIELVSLPSDDNPRTLNVDKGSVGVFSTVPTSGTKTRKTMAYRLWMVLSARYRMHTTPTILHRTK